MAEDIKDPTILPNQKTPNNESKELVTPQEIHNLAEQKKVDIKGDKKLLFEKQQEERKRKLAEQKQKIEEKKKAQAKKRIRPILRYYNSDLLIPVGRSQIIPGNLYCFSYTNFKHVPTPIVFYIGSNPRYQTLEGISLQYLSVAERKRLIMHFRKTELNSPKMISNGLKITDLQGQKKHIFRRSYTSDSIYHYMKRKMKDKVYFYRRYKYNKIRGRIYVVPIEAVDRAIEINTPVVPINPKVLEESKKHFATIINKIKSPYK